MPSKKILIISHEFPPQIGGVGTMGQYLFEAFKDCNEIDVSIMTRNHPGFINTDDDIVRVAYIPKIFVYPYLLKIKKLNLSDYHTIILNGQSSTLIGSLCIPRIHWKKCIVYIHGSELETYNKQTKFALKTLYKNYFLILEKSKRVIFCSEYLMNKFKNSGIKGKFKSISNFVDENIFYRRKINSKISKDDILISVGRLVKEKGYDQMLDDFYELQKMGYNYKWLIIGSGPYQNQLKNKIQKLGLLDTVCMLGNIPKHELNKYYSSAKLFWLYSKSESFGLSYLEANACGIPFLKKDIPGLEQISKNNVNSFIREKYNSIVDFIRYFESKVIDEEEIISISRSFSKKVFTESWINEINQL